MQNEYEVEVENVRGEESRIILIVSCFLHSFGKKRKQNQQPCIVKIPFCYLP
jgi:hypothetical protein